MSVIGTIVVLGSGFIASAGVTELAKTAITKVVTSQESQKLMIKVGTLVAASVAGSVVGQAFVKEVVDPIVSQVEIGIEKIKLEIKEIKDSKK